MRYSLELLPNGLIRVFDRACHWMILYHPNGTIHSGLGNTETNNLVRDFLARKNVVVEAFDRLTLYR